MSATKVLVVDDDPLAIELILEYLEDGDYDVETAYDGDEAWALLDAEPDRFDVVLLDRRMPRMDGMEVMARIKEHAGLRSLPVIIQTAAADREQIIEGINAGAYYYLTKPFEREIMVSMIRAAALDYARVRVLQAEVRTSAGMLGLMRTGVFEFSSPAEATDLGSFLAKACPDPERVVVGLSELLINAVEHGNLEISYKEKSELNRTGTWSGEIRRRLESPEYASRVATVCFERVANTVTISIRDQGRGFDPRPYLQIDPARVFDSHGRGIAIANLLSFDGLHYREGGREAVATITCGPPMA
jgi:CheY-like chemotaxis protein